jgi:hypothetical protein
MNRVNGVQSTSTVRRRHGYGERSGRTVGSRRRDGGIRGAFERIRKRRHRGGTDDHRRVDVHRLSETASFGIRVCRMRGDVADIVVVVVVVVFGSYRARSGKR